MDMLQIAAIGIVAVILVVLVKNHRPEIALQMVVVTGIIIFLAICAKLLEVVEIIESMASSAGIDMAYITIIFKIVGIAYIAKFASQVCGDAGENAIASKIELAGKVFIIVTAAPIIRNLLDLLLSIT